MTTKARDEPLPGQTSGLARLVANCIALTAMATVPLHADILRGELVSTETFRAADSCSYWPTIQFDNSRGERHTFAPHESVKPFVVEVVTSSELDQGQSLIAVLNQDIIPACVCLPSLSRPSTVSRFVVAVWVNSVHRVTDWPRPHMVTESGEVIQPLRAHLDSPAAPVVKTNGIRVIATLFRVSPRPIFWRGLSGFSSSDQSSVLDAVLPGSLSLEASAAARSGVSQRLTGYDCLLAAITSTFPFGMSAGIDVSGDCHQPTKAQSGQVIKFHAHILPHRVIP